MSGTTRPEWASGEEWEGWEPLTHGIWMRRIVDYSDDESFIIDISNTGLLDLNHIVIKCKSPAGGLLFAALMLLPIAFAILGGF